LPDVQAGYLVFVDAFAHLRTESLQRLLDVYDAHLRANPDDVSVAIDRCRFLLAARDLEEDAGDDSSDCITALAERFPTTPAVLQFQIDHRWREQAVELGIATTRRTDIPWLKGEAADYSRSVALAQLDSDKVDDALETASTALHYDPKVDVNLVFARALKRDGHIKEAITELAHSAPRKDRAHAEIALLLDLGGFREALALIEIAQHNGVDGLEPLQARALLGAGRADEARAMYKKLGSYAWKRDRRLRGSARYRLGERPAVAPSFCFAYCFSHGAMACARSVGVCSASRRPTLVRDRACNRCAPPPLRLARPWPACRGFHACRRALVVQTSVAAIGCIARAANPCLLRVCIRRADELALGFAQSSSVVD
jgi:tetratricopeptide (TPR) repeat protein